jgi:8-hydroxy-5-deazaflavin:NADPH oxidoreductase
VLWSCVNALKPDFSGLAVGFDTSVAEEVARRATGARVVAAIPRFAHAIASGDLAYDHGLAPSVFLGGDDPGAKAVVERLVRDIGAQPGDAGAPRDVGLRLLERTSG